MKKTTKPRTRLITLDPLAAQMLNHVCRVEGLTPEEVLQSLLERHKAKQEAKR
jgi:hypothetical protein